MEMNMEGETPGYMALPNIKFRLTLEKNPQLQQALLAGIKEFNMAPYYQACCASLDWPVDQNLLAEMTKINQEKLASFTDDDSETPAWQDKYDLL